MARVWLATLSVLLIAGCRGAGVAARAAPLPHPDSLGGWLALAVFVFGLWWIALKILRG